MSSRISLLLRSISRYDGITGSCKRWPQASFQISRSLKTIKSPKDIARSKGKKPPVQKPNKPNSSLEATLINSIKDNKEIKLRNTLREEFAKYGMAPPRSHKTFISFADRLTPSTIIESLGITPETFIQLQRKINFDGRCEDVIVQLIRERIYYVILIEKFAHSFDGGQNGKNAEKVGELIGFSKLQKKDEFNQVMKLKAEEYPDFFHKSSRDIIDVAVLKKSLKINIFAKLKSMGKRWLGFSK